MPRQLHDFRMKSRSTQIVVGLCGNEIRMTFGVFAAVRYSFFRPSRNVPGVRHGQHTGLALGHDYAVLMNRISGIGRNNHIARANDGKQQMRESVLRADGDDGLLVGIERDPVLFGIRSTMASRSGAIPGIPNTDDSRGCGLPRSSSRRPAPGRAHPGCPFPCRQYRCPPRAPCPSSRL